MNLFANGSGTRFFLLFFSLGVKFMFCSNPWLFKQNAAPAIKGTKEKNKTKVHKKYFLFQQNT